MTIHREMYSSADDLQKQVAVLRAENAELRAKIDTLNAKIAFDRRKFKQLRK